VTNSRGVKLSLVLATAALAACTVGKDGKEGPAGVPCVGCVDAASLAPGAVTAGALQDGAIRTQAISAKAITAAQIADATIAAPQIAPNAIGTTQIAAASVTAAKLAPGAVTTGVIGAAVVGTAEIADGTVTSAKLALGGNLAKGSTLRGMWVVEWAAAVANENFGTFVPFGFTLASPPIAHFVAVGTSTPECPGNVNDPQAIVGHLCFYEFFNNNTTNRALCSLGVCGATPGNSTPWGTWFRVNSIGAGFAHTRGTWAVTAP
jgi:hypothetical protein